ncbi:MAG TPA: RNA polymerase sigma factor [Solirubrobacteraceae bacterium]|nr:RNA polymerase sigma factor [Solirubrobacteraceae bacterium]
MVVVISDRLLEGSDGLLDGEGDERLVRLVQMGHDAAFAAIVRRYERELQAQAHHLTSDGRGEDAVQQAFLNAFSALRGGARVRHLRGWLHQILRNEVMRARLPIDAPLDAVVEGGETLEDTVQRRAAAHAALAELRALPDRQRDALLGTAVLGFPRAHVAHTMGLSEGAVRQLVHRARLRLRQGLTALIPFPLVRFFGAARSGVDAAPDAAVGAGAAAASGGLAIKMGALVASGVVATGLAVTHSFPSRHHPAGGKAAHRAPHARVASTSASESSSSAAVPGHRPVSTALRLGDPAANAAREGEAGRAALERLSRAQSGRSRGGSGAGRGRADGRGHQGSGTSRGDDGGSGSTPGSAGTSGGSGSHEGAVSSVATSGRGDGQSSGGDTSVEDGGGSGSGRGKENSPGSRDLSGSSDSSSS